MLFTSLHVRAVMLCRWNIPSFFHRRSWTLSQCFLFSVVLTVTWRWAVARLPKWPPYCWGDWCPLLLLPSQHLPSSSSIGLEFSILVIYKVGTAFFWLLTLDWFHIANKLSGLNWQYTTDTAHIKILPAMCPLNTMDLIMLWHKRQRNVAQIQDLKETELTDE